jgi:hypothetical protein
MVSFVVSIECKAAWTLKRACFARAFARFPRFQLKCDIRQTVNIAEHAVSWPIYSGVPRNGVCHEIMSVILYPSERGYFLLRTTEEYFWGVAVCSLVEIYPRFKGIYCLRLQGRVSQISKHQASLSLLLAGTTSCSTLKMEAVCYSETLVDLYQTTLCNIPEVLSILGSVRTSGLTRNLWSCPADLSNLIFILWAVENASGWSRVSFGCTTVWL